MPVFLSLLASATLKATAILMLGALAAWLMRHRTAASRHLVWTAALGAVTAVPGFSIVLPAWHVMPAPAVFATDAASVLTLNAPSRQHRASISPAWRASSARAAPDPPVAPRLPVDVPGWPARILLLWVIGAAVVVCRDMIGRITLYRLVRSSSRHVEYDTMVRELARDMGIRRRVRVSCSDDVELPMTWGVFRPRIFLPGDAADWSSACRRHVLQHELAHVSRGDAATQLVALVAKALFWFHPLVWLAVARMRFERERACDDQVLSCGALASDYAAELLAFVGQYGFIESQTIALGFAERSRFEQRLAALLDPSAARGELSRACVTLVVALATVIVLPLAAMQRAIHQSAHRPTILAPVLAVAPASLPRPRAIPVASRPVMESDRPSVALFGTTDAFESCALRITSEHSHDSTDGAGNSGWMATGENAGCRYALASAGTVVLNGDATAIEQISAGGYLDLSTNIHGDVTRLIARASADGGVSYQFSHNDELVVSSLAGGAWLQRFLLCVDRTTAFAIDRRFPLLLRAGGPANVLDEVERMHSDYAVSVYLTRLVRTSSLDSSSLGRIGQMISRMMPQHMAGEVIIAIASRQHLPDDVRDDLMKTAERLRESSIRSRALAALAQRR